MPEEQLQPLVQALTSGKLDRRAFMKASAAAGVTAAAAGMLADSALAQDATPAASPAGGGTKSITRDEYLALLRESFPYEEAESEGGQVIIASTSDIATLNPVVRSDVIALYAINNIFNYLATQNPIDGTMYPDLADYWELGADGMTYTFYLNQNATWHDGEPVTADDCVMTFDAVMDEKSISPLASDFIQNVASYRAVDTHTFEMKAPAPAALVLEKTVGAIPIMPKHIWGDIPHAEWASSPGSTGTDPSKVIGSGPFVFKEWVLGDHVTISRNENYWLPDGVPHIDEFTIQIIAEPETAVQSVVVGDTDMFRGLAPSQIERVRSNNAAIEIVTYETMSFGGFVMNASQERGSFFSDTAVRQALMYAVDRELVVESMLDGLGTPSIGVQPPPSPAYAPDQVTTVYNYDPEKSKQLLEDAGWVDSDGDGVREKDGVKFSAEFLFSEGSTLYEQLIPYLKQVFADVGVEVLPKSVPAPTLSEQVVGSGDYEISTTGITWTLDDQGVLYRCDAFPPAGFNLPRHCNPEYDRLNTESQTELDPEKRRQLMIDQGNISNDDAHWGIMYFGQGVFPVNSRVRNAFFSAYTELFSYADLWIKAE